MVLEYEVPNGSNLYFGTQAYKRRSLINAICDIFLNHNFEEIVTPYFSYASLQNDYNNKLISFKDKDNRDICLRCDSTLDVARLVTKRLGRSTTHKKWFYSQSVFSHPSNEFYQIGCEWLDCKEHQPVLNILIEILNLLNSKIQNSQESILLVTNTKISSKVKQLLGYDESIKLESNIDTLFNMNKKWLDALIQIQNINDIDKSIDIMPQELKSDLEHLKQIIIDCKLDTTSLVISPLYEVSANYYDGVCYSVFNGNDILISGGEYKSNGFASIGFGVLIDNILKKA